MSGDVNFRETWRYGNRCVSSTVTRSTVTFLDVWLATT
ncbi:Uncharacterized protein pbN1_36190 [Aromatoleum bremense]|nr:Uncharacterized protein pbN1_36190 [Aromatoleum bremense]